MARRTWPVMEGKERSLDRYFQASLHTAVLPNIRCLTRKEQRYRTKVTVQLRVGRPGAGALDNRGPLSPACVSFSCALRTRSQGGSRRQDVAASPQLGAPPSSRYLGRNFHISYFVPGSAFVRGQVTALRNLRLRNTSHPVDVLCTLQPSSLVL
jgi:hypothetical protein